MKHWAMTRLAMALIFCSLTVLPLAAQGSQKWEDILAKLSELNPKKNVSSADIEDQKIVKAVLADVSKEIGIVAATKLKVQALLHKGHIPFVDLDVYFDLDSAAITNRAKATLDPLARAIGDIRLKKATFVVAGFTDVTGKADYNRDLSVRRANAVKDYLTAKAGLPAQQFIAAGFGETHLKNKTIPTSPVNRRVQIINVGG